MFCIIACNAVRYIGAKTENVYGSGTGQIWLDNVRCNGTETDIDDCSHTGWGVHSCRHHGYVAISCTTGMCCSDNDLQGIFLWVVQVCTQN